MPQTVAIACSIFRPELEQLRSRGKVEFSIRYFDSTLHMVPPELAETLTGAVSEERGRGRRVLLVYGDCHPYMSDAAKDPEVGRVRGCNCCEILLGKESYRRLRREKVFFLLPEWILRWRETIAVLPGADAKTTIDIMRDEHAKLLFLDTGALPVPDAELRACSEYFGLPYEVLAVSLEHMLGEIEDALREVESREE